MKEVIDIMDSMSFSVAEELEAKKARVRNERERKFTTKNRNGNHNRAATEGLKEVRTNGKKRKQYIIIDDEFQVDVTRIRNLSDVILD